MRRKTVILYYTILPNGNFCSEVVNAPLPTYPHALRFDSYKSMELYSNAKSNFIQSTKIPASCEKCPVDSLCGGYHETIMCHVLWRKIWEYVK